jgi:CHAT domain-containing protein/Tfp pilus assembly protein PilF
VTLHFIRSAKLYCVLLLCGLAWVFQSVAVIAQTPNQISRISEISAKLQGQISAGDNTGAVESMNEFADLFASVAGPNHPQVLETRLMTVPLLLTLGRNDDALVTAKKMLAQIQGGSPIDRRLLAIAHDRLGMVHQTKRDDDRAANDHRLALETNQSIGKKDSIEWADAATNLAQVLTRQNQLVEARDLSVSALDIYRRLAGIQSPKIATALNNLGLLQVQMGEKDAAEKNLVDALAVYRKLYGDDHPELASSHSSLALLYASRPNKEDLAKQHYQDALRLASKHFGDEHPTTATIQNNLGNWYLDQGNLDEAEQLLRASLKYRLSHLGLDHPSTSLTRHNLATLLAIRGQWDEAVSMLEQSVKVFQAEGGSSIAMAANSKAYLGTFAAINQKPEQAIADFDDARRLATDYVWNTLSQLDTDQQQKLLAQPFTSTLHSALTLASRFPDSQPVLAATAKWLANGKGIAEEALARGRSKEPLAAMEFVSIESIQESIPKSAVLVDIIRQDIVNFDATKYAELFTEPHYVAWIIPNEGDIHRQDLGPAADIDKLVDAMRRETELSGGIEGRIAEVGEIAATNQWIKTAFPLTQSVWNPIAKLMPAKTNQVILSPDSSLWLVPWTALPLSDNDTKESDTDNTQARFVIEDFVVSTVTSGRSLVQSSNAYTGKRSTPAVFSDPNFDQNANEKRQSFFDIFRRSPSSDGTRSVVARSLKMRATPLPGTALETAAITPSLTKWLDGQAPTNYQGRFAMESVAKKLRNPASVVFATHGFFLDSERLSGSADPLDRCGLLLAGCNDPASIIDEDDGVLLGSEITLIPLQGTSLVVLSACETGIGKVEDGNGVAGLRRAFHLAGAINVASTLWQIPDFDTAKLMREFFASLAEGTDMSRSLQAAQVQRIESRRTRHGAAHPYFWAGFVLSGPVN